MATAAPPLAPSSLGIMTPPSSPPLGSSQAVPRASLAAVVSSSSPSQNGTPPVASEKRNSTGNGASRYPSPPLDPASLYIPPFNPNTRRRSQQQQQPMIDVVPPLQAVQSANVHREGKHRPVSAAVVPTPQAYSPATGQRGERPGQRNRASHHIQPASTAPSTDAVAPPLNMIGVNHPMPRQRIYFGPYLLLQTLGEGEFGKVKLGVHSAPDRWGEEVAIKLIKRGNVDTQARMVKVAREIDVLRLVHHPNIVRLYDVIETEKYIGIVLEYASGGELFDHILAHRYLKEKDASKLFAQLISGVRYLHNKGIVHRDLKLENLLLDRHRNVIITDFGFANRFADQTSDLMATSCGSPCYAAPELVVQDGRYVGSAVDVWSCGVILYAMLAGYLPFDDDPANPDGDNINLLYKYIINTPLSFPDWISSQPRDLLLRMLVPDPAKRCTLDDVAAHPWLARFSHLFERTVDDLEMAAGEAERSKRTSLQRQRQLIAEQQQSVLDQQQSSMARSQSVSGARALAGGVGGRGHQSAMVTSATSDQLYAATPSRQAATQQQPAAASKPPVSNRALGPTPPSTVTSRSRGHSAAVAAPPTTQVSNLHTSADAFSYGAGGQNAVSSMPMAPSISAPARGPEREREDVVMSDFSEFGGREQDAGPAAVAATTSSARKRKAAARHTVQVEYASSSRPTTTGPPPVTARSGGGQRARAAMDEDVVMASVPESPPQTFVPQQDDTTREEEDEEESEAVATPAVEQSVQELVEPPSTPKKEVWKEEEALKTPSQQPGLPRVEVNVPTPAKASPKVSVPPTETSQAESDEGQDAPVEAGDVHEEAARQADLQPPKRQRPAQPNAARPTIPERVESRNSNLSGTSTSSVEAARRAARHRKGMSTDRFFSRLLGSSTSSETAPRTGSPKKAQPAPQPAAPAATTAPAEERRKARRKALSMVVEPLAKGSPVKQQPRKSEAAPATSPGPAMTTVEKRRSRLSSAALAAVSAAQTPSRPVTRSSTANKLNGNLAPPASSTSPASKTASSDASWISTAASSSAQSAGGAGGSKAKKVMDWFRFKSLHEGQQPAPIPTDFDARRSRRESMGFLNKRPATARSPAPAVVVTPTPAAPSAATTTPTTVTAVDQANPDGASSRSASGTTTLTASTVATTVSAGTATEPAPSKPAPAAKRPVTTTFAKPAEPAPFNDSKLRLHHGAIDQNALSGKLPPLLMKDVRRVLWEMGIDVVEESTMKLKATRRSRKKVAASLGLGISALEQQQQSSRQRAGTGASVAGQMPSFSQQSSPMLQNEGLRSPLLSASVSSSSAGHATPTLGGSAGLTASPSSTFRSLFQRKNSSQSVTNLAASTASSPGFQGQQLDDAGLLMSPQPQAVQGQPLPAYGEDPSMDSGDDVRFTVEITRMKGFDKLYAVDIKRLRGSLWSFKYLYLQIVEKLDLSTKA